jgi:3-hydroxyisobutyrate dehydrogenase-like beta-hydroxyacid dehydrogenase
MNMIKDLDLAMDTACRYDLTLPLTAAAQAVYKSSDSSGLSKKDYTSVASYLLEQNSFSTFLKRLE